MDDRGESGSCSVSARVIRSRPYSRHEFAYGKSPSADEVDAIEKDSSCEWWEGRRNCWVGSIVCERPSSVVAGPSWLGSECENKPAVGGNARE